MRCQGCEAHCCARYRVPLTALELVRVVDRTGHEPLEVVVPFVVSKRERYAGFRLDRSDDLWDLALAKANGKPHGAPCRYLVRTPDGAGLCGVYEVRPGPCRAFPVTVVDGKQSALPDLVCPPDRVRDDVLEVDPAWLPLVHRMDLEAVIHESLAAEWNRRVIQHWRRHFELSELVDFLLARGRAWLPLAAKMGDNAAQMAEVSARHRSGINPLLD